MELRTLLNKAIERRHSLVSITNCLRLVNGKGDACDGLLIDRYHQHVQIQVLHERWSKRVDEIAQILISMMPVDYLIVKSRQGLNLSVRVLKQGDPKTIVDENGLKFEVDLNDGLNCGLFLDMRANRRMVAAACRAKKVFNGFAYTCSFGLYARAHGATEVINTDISKRTLKKAEDNYRLNGYKVSPDEFIAADTLAYLNRAVKKQNLFDIIILDPPSFSRHEGKTFQVKRDMPLLIQTAVEVLRPKGRLFVSTNYSEISHAQLEEMLAKSLNTRRVEKLERVGQDQDFPGSNSFKESYLSGLWAKFL